MDIPGRIFATDGGEVILGLEIKTTGEARRKLWLPISVFRSLTTTGLRDPLGSKLLPHWEQVEEDIL